MGSLAFETIATRCPLPAGGGGVQNELVEPADAFGTEFLQTGMDGAIRETGFGRERIVAPCRGRPEGVFEERGGQRGSTKRPEHPDETQARSRRVAPDPDETGVLACLPDDTDEVGGRVERGRLSQLLVEPLAIASPSVGAGNIPTQPIVQLEQACLIDSIGRLDAHAARHPRPVQTPEDRRKCNTKPLGRQLGDEPGRPQRRLGFAFRGVNACIHRTSQCLHHRM